MGMLAVKEKLASGSREKLIRDRITVVTHLVADLHKESEAANDDVASGAYYDSETGLHYNGARYYDPRTGRYLQSDPLGLVAGLNTYAYVDSNPLRFIDPSGLSTVVVDVDRTSSTATATMGQLKVNGSNIGCTLELPWIDNKNDISSILPGAYNARLKIRPNGTRAIELLRVPNRTDILIHPANLSGELKGCIAPGKTCGKSRTFDSGAAMKEILDLVDFARNVDKATDDVTDIIIRIR